jgi:hypothetical protein
MTYCCPELEKLAHPSEAGFRLVVVINKRGPRFLLMYQKAWQLPVAEGGIQIRFCPYCGSKLIGPSPTHQQDL